MALDIDGDRLEKIRRGMAAAGAEAGAIAMRHFRREHDHWEKEPGQIVTEADIAIDRLLAARLGALMPEAAWLSEESVDDPARLDSHWLWIVDPIDGTRSFSAGKPEFAICIALVDPAGPLMAWLGNPATDEVFTATRGGGASLNGEPIAVASSSSIDGARIAVSAGETRRRRFESLLPSASVTSIGSLAYKIVLVACGRFDAYFSWRRAQDWDIAAADLVLREAGGRISDAEGGAIAFNRPEPVHEGLIAAPPALHGELAARSRAMLAARRSAGKAR